MKLRNPSIYLIVILICCPFVIFAQDKLPSPENQIAAAVSPAPEDLHKVLGYNAEGELKTLRKGTNELTCLADDPEQSNFHTSKGSLLS